MDALMSSNATLCFQPGWESLQLLTALQEFERFSSDRMPDLDDLFLKSN